MAVKIYGLTQLVRQPNSVLAEESSGLVTFTEEQVGRRADVESAFFNLVRFTSSSPDFPWLKLDSKRITYSDGGQSVLSLVWAGGQGAGTPEDPEEILSEPVWELKRTPSEEPIETKENFTSFAGTPSNPLNGAEFDEETGLFIGFKVPESGDNEFGGLTKYLENRAVVTKVSITQTPLNPSQLIPRRDTPLGVPFAIPSGGDRNYLKTDFTFVRRGGVYENYEEWTLSGPNGWNSDVYP